MIAGECQRGLAEREPWSSSHTCRRHCRGRWSISSTPLCAAPLSTRPVVARRAGSVAHDGAALRPGSQVTTGTR